MQILDLELKGLKLITPRLFEDARGIFFESYRDSFFRAQGIDVTFVQDNQSLSKQGTLRGLHFQSSPGQDKLVSCIEGEIWDVAVDLRPFSETYLSWKAVVLKDGKQLFIPKGFAHGFCVLSNWARVHYKVSDYYNPETEASIRWNDPDLNIRWPVDQPILSFRDQTSPFLREVNRVTVDYR
ncbi:MAG: dTDP-4-dehydrorhamnose 3,5-epimerase [Chlamydiae bacterium RIFCSPHIGHO2_12_FULL_44_59]|nr:MAG: dTDP-4-dehydrorhamnose 3,5-epimerase [Chlamydiae bacterium RIFCSPHIGHO2_01_FULL_44_39]OGN59125.1 MAG: dTDP-4-dehydrorhamnose 3,5-epimerase [Chlamydiae bacterium RIFCSPHIGHO2_02_FULL_45_9]OGN61136.1 MAG: dTDP-4-dehydrorhamnose 3,5-epimerase [Chlamydiae bacterium RIFCSPHIGHO2_12_FULL_44_59]OGN65606.1 MAG: dTDP-4-dehydrorhamnose 3,5-epimerase [Chlamydiae bacterium RIFCSPLOWO2_01_FULL_44_52]OGN68083.1 MAG: dTDP-4-dehydrorhamnose 3,5-epimerase [Chlamydiae bacterium RIFCSPLOWO2_02_FULL_45_22]